MDERFLDIKNRYPNITSEEVDLLSAEEFNKLSINFLERLIKDYKYMLQETFKTSSIWPIPKEDVDWYKTLLRDEKNALESVHRDMVNMQRNLREGLNPPFCYKTK